jgi:hypothetical protein
MESRLPHPIPQDILTKLAGKTFVVHPRQLGLNPWGKKVEVIFESVEAPAPAPAPAPTPVPPPVPVPDPAPPKPVVKAGIPVSALIAAALKAQ